MGNLWYTSSLIYILPLRDHTIVKLLLNLKKHALQDDTKVLGVKWMMFNNFCGKKQNKCFGLFLLGGLSLNLENFVLNSILEFFSLTLTSHRI